MLTADQAKFLSEQSFVQLTHLMEDLFYGKSAPTRTHIFVTAQEHGIQSHMVCAECLNRIYHTGV